MIPKGLFTQIAMIGLSIGIFFTYIQPSFSEVKKDQDAILRYQEERAKVQAVNIKLNELVLKAEEISPTERTALDTYVPSEVDTVAVQRDLLLIAQAAGVELTALSGTAAGAPTAGVAEESLSTRTRLVSHEFSFAFTAPYETIKEFLELIEKNNYPLTLTSLSIAAAAENPETAQQTDDLSAAVTVTTYALEFLDAAELEPTF